MYVCMYVGIAIWYVLCDSVFLCLGGHVCQCVYTLYVFSVCACVSIFRCNYLCMVLWLQRGLEHNNEDEPHTQRHVVVTKSRFYPTLVLTEEAKQEISELLILPAQSC